MKQLTLFIFLFGFWLMLTFSLVLSNLLVGAIASLIATLIFGKHFLSGGIRCIEPNRYYWLLIYLVIFIWECIKANFDVAYRVLHPAMPIRPGIVKVKTELKSDFARMMLANSITMTPGTITVDIIGDYFYVHWIFVGSEDPEIYSHKVMGRFEKYIKKIFE
jgi:multicomponent Na+:H+ antiporter subunit E